MAERIIDIENEKLFHNITFSDETIRGNRVGKFYQLQQSILQEFHKELNSFVKPDSSIIEIGCGLDENIYASLNGCKNRYAVDLSDVAIEKQKLRSKEKGVHVNFFVSDAHKIDYPDASFDLIFGTSILHHLNLKAALAEYKRLLKPGGKIVFIEPLGINPIINYFRNKTPELRTPDEKPFDRADIQLVKQIFPKTKFQYFDITTLALPILFGKKIPSKAISFFHAADKLIFTLLPFMKKQAWQILISAGK